VTIDTLPTDASSGYFNGSTLFTSIQFDPLYDEDEGQYVCYAIINGSFLFESISLQNFTSAYVINARQYSSIYTIVLMWVVQVRWYGIYCLYCHSGMY